MICDLCDCNLFLLRCQNPLCFLGLVVAKAGEVGGFLLAHTIDFLAISLWDSWLRASLQNLLLVYPEKCWFLRKS